MRQRRAIVVDRLAGAVLGTTIFLLLHAFAIGGAIDCVSKSPGLHCALVQLAFGDGQPGEAFRSGKQNQSDPNG